MIIIKVCKDNYVKNVKMSKFHPTYRSESLCKADSRNLCFAKSAGTIFRFPFFNPVFKNTKIS